MSHTARLWTVLLVNVLLVTGLVVVGLAAHSLGVLAEGGDYLADAAAIGVSLTAIWLSKKPATTDRPDGYHRATTIAALINAGWLLLLSLIVIATAAVRLLRGTRDVHGLPVLIVSGIAALVMLGCALLLAGDDDDDGEPAAPTKAGDDLNMRAVLLDTATDAAAAAGVAVTGAVILATGGNDWLDPAVALLIALVVAFHAGKLLVAIAHALHSAGPKA